MAYESCTSQPPDGGNSTCTPRLGLCAAVVLPEHTTIGNSRPFAPCTVRMRTELVIRFDYGSVLPWVRRLDDETIVALGGPDGLVLRLGYHVSGRSRRSFITFCAPRANAR